MKLDTSSGSLKLLDKESVIGTVMPLAVSPDRRYLYASLRSEPYSVTTFKIDPDKGMISPLQTVQLPDNMAYLSLDQTGRFLFGASYSGNKISVNAIGPDGTVDSVPRQVLQTGKNAHAIITDRNNKFVYVTNLGDDQILHYTFNAHTGMLRPNNSPMVKTAEGAGPRHIVAHPTGRYWFGINELNGTVTTYQAHRLGTLTMKSSITLMPSYETGKPSAADIHLHPNGQFLYTTERTSNTICAFNVDQRTGSLSLIGHYPTEKQPRSFQIDPKGKFLIAAGQQSHRLSIYQINQNTGELTKISEAPAGKNPNWIEIIQLP